MQRGPPAEMFAWLKQKYQPIENAYYGWQTI
jgi:hypothetical protein